MTLLVRTFTLGLVASAITALTTPAQAQTTDIELYKDIGDWQILQAQDPATGLPVGCLVQKHGGFGPLYLGADPFNESLFLVVPHQGQPGPLRVGVALDDQPNWHMMDFMSDGAEAHTRFTLDTWPLSDPTGARTLYMQIDGREVSWDLYRLDHALQLVGECNSDVISAVDVPDSHDALVAAMTYTDSGVTRHVDEQAEGPVLFKWDWGVTARAKVEGSDLTWRLQHRITSESFVKPGRPEYTGANLDAEGWDRVYITELGQGGLRITMDLSKADWSAARCEAPGAPSMPQMLLSCVDACLTSKRDGAPRETNLTAMWVPVSTLDRCEKMIAAAR